MEKIKSIEIVIKIYPERYSSLHTDNEEELIETLTDNIKEGFQDIAGLPMDDIEITINR